MTSVACAAAGYVSFGRTWQFCWGATDQECELGLLGDELIANADLTATRAITVRAAAAEVWPWIAQLGHGRGGFYSYDILENLLGCDIHSADRIAPRMAGRRGRQRGQSGSRGPSHHHQFGAGTRTRPSRRRSPGRHYTAL